MDGNHPKIPDKTGREMTRTGNGHKPDRKWDEWTGQPHQRAHSHLVRFRPEEQQVERDGGHHVDEEPALEVVHGDLAGMRHDLVILVDVRRAEVDEDVDDEHDVHDEVDDVEGVVVARRARTVLGARLLVEQEGGDVRREDGGVDDEDEDQPVPHSLEGRVVQDGEAVHARRLQLVLGQHLSTQR